MRMCGETGDVHGVLHGQVGKPLHDSTLHAVSHAAFQNLCTADAGMLIEVRLMLDVWLWILGLGVFVLVVALVARLRGLLAVVGGSLFWLFAEVRSRQRFACSFDQASTFAVHRVIAMREAR